MPAAARAVSVSRRRRTAAASVKTGSSRQDRRVDGLVIDEPADEEDLVERHAERARRATAADGRPASRTDSPPWAPADEIEQDGRRRDAERGERQGRDRRESELPEDRKERETDLRAGERRRALHVRDRAGAVTRRRTVGTQAVTTHAGRSAAETSVAPSAASNEATPRPIGPERADTAALVTRDSSRSGRSGRRDVPGSRRPASNRNPTSRRVGLPYVLRRATISWPT
jgi:hypothetical protein